MVLRLFLLPAVLAVAGPPDAVLAKHPGCAAGVLHRDRIVFAGGAGGVTARSSFYLASLSKQFTAAAVYTLAEAGQLKLDAPARDWLPGLPIAITVRHLLHHTSGLRDYSALQEISGSRDRLDNAAVLAMMNRQRDLNFRPGTEFEYSNSGYALLGAIVERASGTTIDAYARRRIFLPVGMTSSRFHVAASMDVPPSVGDGGMYSTVEDLLRWLRAWRRPPLTLRPALEAIWSRARLDSGEAIAHASGLFHHDEFGRHALSHNGSFGAWSTSLLHLPAEDLSVVCLCRTADRDATAVGREITAAVLGLPSPSPPRPAGEAPSPTHSGPVAAFAAAFRNDDLDVDWTLVDDKGTLYITTAAGWRIPLIRTAPARFTVGPWTLEFHRDPTGRVYAFDLSRERVRRLPFTRVPGSAPASAATSRP